MAISKPISVKIFKFSNSAELESSNSEFALWQMKGSYTELTILATAQSSWVVDGEVKHMLTVLYHEVK